MNSIFEKHKWLKYVVGAFIVIMGILVIVFGSMKNIGTLEEIVAITLSVGAFIIGLFLLVTCLLNESHKGFTLGLLISTLLLSSGIILLVTKFGIKFGLPNTLLVYIITISILVLGVVCLVKAISLIIYKERKGLIALFIICAILGITLGILGVCFAKDSGLIAAAYIILGVAIVTIGIISLIFAAISDKKKKDA